MRSFAAKITTLIVMLLAAASYADPIEVSIEPGYQLGKLLHCLGHRKLWGPKGAVAKTTRLNFGRKVRKQGDLIFPRTTLLLPLPEGLEETALQTLAMQCSKAEQKRVAKASSKPGVESEYEGFSGNAAEASPIGSRRAPTAEEEDLLAEDATKKPKEPTAADETSEVSALLVSPPPESAAGATHTPSPIRTSEPGPDNRSVVGKAFRAGANVGVHNIRVNSTLGNDSYTQVGLGISLGFDVAVARQVFLFTEGQLQALPISDGSSESVRTIRLAIGSRIRLVDAGLSSVYLFSAIEYQTLLGLSVRSGYQNVFGLSVGAEWRRALAARAILVRIGSGIFSSDTSIVSFGNFTATGCLGFGAERSWSDARWTILGCGKYLRASFANGIATEVAGTLGTEFRF